MPDDMPPLLGSDALSEVIEAFDWKRFEREHGDNENAWLAAHAALLHGKPVRFERVGENAFYIAPFDPNLYQQHTIAFAQDHLRLEELLAPDGENLPVPYREQLPSTNLRRYYMHFRVRSDTGLDVTVQVPIDAASRDDAEQQFRTGWPASGDMLKEATARALMGMLSAWEPRPEDFELIYTSLPG